MTPSRYLIWRSSWVVRTCGSHSWRSSLRTWLNLERWRPRIMVLCVCHWIWLMPPSPQGSALFGTSPIVSPSGFHRYCVRNILVIMTVWVPWLLAHSSMVSNLAGSRKGPGEQTFMAYRRRCYWGGEQWSLCTLQRWSRCCWGRHSLCSTFLVFFCTTLH